MVAAVARRPARGSRGAHRMEKRRSCVRRHAQALIAAVALCGAAQACELPAGTRLESAGFVLSYRTLPAAIAPGEHFSLEYALCPKAGAVLPATVKVHAWMPEHRHGMNYKASVAALGGGRFRAQGLLFHMPGRWEIVFEADGERLSHSLRLE
ncbi:MAG: hypothetical protein EPN19_12005 [Betaproteobacteria bacterium]|nr:MAG: hypothetical protein EPN19_12005 [Betaproteobacteria bacterium]